MLAITDKFTQKSAKAQAGGVSSRNSKMPGSSYAQSTDNCLVGAVLALVEGSVCFECYAAKNEAFRPSVKKGWTDNYMSATNLIAKNPSQWAKAMSFQIRVHAIKNEEASHRWFDAGDLSSLAMLEAIVMVAEMTPEVRHWLPTREAAMVKAWRKAGGIEPSNLIIRMSATMVNDGPISGHCHTSTVHTKGKAHTGHACPSTTVAHRSLRDDNKANCGPCRACWDKQVTNVSYPKH